MLKVKTLGPSKKFVPLVPGQYRAPLPKVLPYNPVDEEEDEGLQDLPTTASLPPFEPLGILSLLLLVSLLTLSQYYGRIQQILIIKSR